jgi:HlyB family type I secretion system ABC transporter
MQLTTLRPATGVRASLDDLPILRLLPDDVRALVIHSFVPVSFAFGAVLAREGEAADAMFVLVSGRARIVKRGDDGGEIPLGTFSAGDTFGEVEILDRAPQPITVRATTDVVALRLDRSVFDALLRMHPEVQAYSELQVKHRRLQSFFREFPAFAHLPAEAVVAIVLAELESVTVEPGQTIVRQGDPPGPLYLVEEGQLRLLRQQAGRRRYLRRLGPGDFFGEMSVFRGIRREATVEALSRCRLLALSEETYRRLLSDVPGFRAQIEAHIDRYDYKRIAKVPDDFDEEILPADATAATNAGPGEADESEDGPDGPFAVDGRFIKRRRPLRRVPLVLQIDETDCGAASLAMVCRYYGRAVSLARIRQLVQTGLDGASLRGLCHAATELGLAARAVKSSARHLAQMPTPAIVHWDGNHWLVLVEVGVAHVRVADPAYGRRRLTVDEFREKWTGYAALFDYTEAFATAQVAKPTIAWLWAFVRPYTGVLVRAAGLAVVVSALQLVLPIFTQVIVDRVVVERDAALLHTLIFAMAAVMVFIVAALGLQRYLVSFVAVRVDAATLDCLARRLLALPAGYFATRRTGDLQRRLDGARQVRDFLVQHGVSAVTAAVQIAATVAVMAVYSPKLTIVFLASAPLYALLMGVSSRVLRPVFERVEETFGNYRSHQIDAIKGIETVKALGGEERFRTLMLDQFQRVARHLFRADFSTMAYEGAVQAVTFLSMALFLWVGAYQVMTGLLTIGGLIAFNSLVAMANAPIVSLLAVWDTLQRSAVLVNRLNDVFEQEPEQGADRSKLRPVHDLDGHISFRSLCFRYGGPESPAILDHITLDIPAGKCLAIVGRSGSGKTTLAKCLAGLLEPTEGSVLYDGVDLKTMNYRDLRQRIGFVLQDTFLFSDTIARNIAFGEQEPDLEQVRWAAAMANAKGFIERLPLGYDTRIGESGIALSGGQRQRIAIARAIYRRPPVLILDEATSSLDSESEKVVQENLDGLLEGHTSVVIAHRLSTIRNADQILVLERGRVVERGTHRELVERQGLYYYLSSQQLLFANGS